MRLNPLCLVSVPLLTDVPSAASSPVQPCSGSPLCGSDLSSDVPTRAAPASSVTVEGKQGEAPEVTFDGRLDPIEDRDRRPHRRATARTWPPVDTVEAHWWIGNGYTEKETQEHL